jgi:hypothetical protein
VIVASSARLVGANASATIAMRSLAMSESPNE